MRAMNCYNELLSMNCHSEKWTRSYCGPLGTRGSTPSLPSNGQDIKATYSPMPTRHRVKAE